MNNISVTQKILGCSRFVTKSLFVLVSFIIVRNSLLAQEPSLIWANSIGGTSYEYATDVVIDDSGNSIVVGYFLETVDFDPGPGINNVTAQLAFDMFVAKYDSAGEFMWVKTFGSGGSQKFHSVQLDSLGDIYLTGYFQGLNDFDPGQSIYNLESNGHFDVFVMKLNDDGDLIWVRSFGGDSEDSGLDVAVSDNGDVLLTGFFQDTVDFDPGPNDFSLISKGGYDVFVEKLDSNGDFVWAKSMGGTNNSLYGDFGKSIVLDSENNIYLAGVFKDTADMDPSGGVEYLYAHQDNYFNNFVMKLTEAGDLVWAKGIPAIYNDNVTQGPGIGLDMDGNVISSGDFQGTVDFDPGPSVHEETAIWFSTNVYLLKLDNNGEFIWVRTLQGQNSEHHHSTQLEVDLYGNIYSLCNFEDTVDFDPSVNEHLLVAEGGVDVGIFKMSSGGDLIWAKSIGGASEDFGYSINVGKDLGVSVAGGFYGTSDLNPSNQIENHTSTGSMDIFVLKMNQDVANFAQFDLGDLAVIYPNPSSENLFNVLFEFPTTFTISISNLSGDIIQTSEVVDQESYSFEIQDAGCYVVHIQTVQQTQVSKIVVL